MKQQEPDRARLQQLYVWLAHPTGVYSLRAVLAQLGDTELLFLMRNITSVQSATLAWAEYGRRHSLATIEFYLHSLDLVEVEVRDLRLAQTVALA